MPVDKNGNLKSKVAKGNGSRMPKRQTVPNANQPKGNTIRSAKKQEQSYKTSDRVNQAPSGTAKAAAIKKGTHRQYKKF